MIGHHSQVGREREGGSRADREDSHGPSGCLGPIVLVLCVWCLYVRTGLQGSSNQAEHALVPPRPLPSVSEAQGS